VGSCWEAGRSDEVLAAFSYTPQRLLRTQAECLA